MPDRSEGTSGVSAFNWALGTPERIESYLIECRATRDPVIIRDAEYLVALARVHLGLNEDIEAGEPDISDRVRP